MQNYHLHLGNKQNKWLKLNMHYFNRTRSAFTLAEVLITLVIIGVVMAILIPTFLENYEARKFAPKIKKAYSVLKQAVITSELLNASTEYWNYNLEAKDFYEQYLKNYFYIIEETTAKTVQSRGIVYYNMDGTVSSEDFVSGENTVVATLADGFSMFISEYKSEKYKAIGIDINGTNQKPNIIGKDFFLFAIQPRYGLTPYGYAESGKVSFGTTYEANKLMNDTPYGCRNIGAYCSAYIILQNWELDKNYPR